MKAIPTREAFGQALLELGEVDKEFIVIDADISKSTYSCLFHEKYPARAYNMGLAEQNMMGVAAGMASTGLTVFATTYAVFASMRALEQVRTFICYPALNVKIAASHGGLQVSSDGVSHQGTEDLAIMRSLPNMTVVQPADPVATRKAVAASIEHSGPLYLRLLRNPAPVIYDAGMDFQLGRGVVLRDSDRAGCAIIATGLMVSKALEAAAVLEREGVETRVVDIHTIKPLDRELVVESAWKTGAVVTAEDHNILGGLGGAVCEVLAGEMPVPVERIGLRDVFGESGEPEELFSEYQMNVEHIAAAVRRAVSRRQWLQQDKEFKGGG